MSSLYDFVDRNTKDLQKLGGGGGKSSGGGSLISNPLGGISSSAIQSVADSLSNIPKPNLDQDLAAPVVNAVEEITKIDAPKVVEDVVNQVTPTVQGVTDAVTNVANTTSNVVQDIVNMDLSPPDYRNAPVPDLMPVVNDALSAVSSVAKPVFDLTKIDYARPFNELLDNANDLLGTTLLTVAGNVEPALDALSDLNPFGGTGGGSGSGDGGGANYQLDASDPNLGDEQLFGDLEKATGKGSKLTEEERLRRIRRLLLNRYGRENTILTSGPGDTRSRRRYAR